MSDAEKRKSRESVHNSSDSEVSDSEFRNVAKKPKLSESRRSSGSPRRSSSSSSSSSSSGSGDEWENREAEGERSKYESLNNTSFNLFYIISPGHEVMCLGLRSIVSLFASFSLITDTDKR